MDDTALIAAIAGGCHDAFAALHSRYSGLMWVYARRLGADPDTADDLCQQAWIKAWRYISSGGAAHVHAARGYLSILVLQEWWELLRKRRPLERYNPERHCRSARDTASEVLERETVRQVARLLTHLNPEDQAVAVLKLFYGYDGKGMAQVLGTSRGAVLHRWARTVNQWRRWAGTKTGEAALEQCLIRAAEERPIPPADQCVVRGCRQPRHAYQRCRKHAEDMLRARRKHGYRGHARNQGAA